MAIPIPLFGLSQAGKSSTVTSQRHVNVYAEIKQDGEKGSVAFYGTPGLTLFTSFGNTPVRGSIAVGDFAYFVHRGVFWEVNNAGVKTNRGSLGTTSGRVRLAHNGPQIGIVDGTSFYVYTIATNAFVVVSTNLVGVPIDITYQDSYGILIYEDGKHQITAPYDFTTLDALDFATAEANPDGLVRGIADHGEIVLAGKNTVEFLGNSGGQDYPYTTQRGSTLEFGLAAADTLVKYNDSLAGLFKNDMGQVQVMMLRGHALVPLSTPEHSDIINSYETVTDATALSYMLGTHPMLQINFPTAGKSWMFDNLTGMWTELQSGLSGGRHLAEIGVEYLSKARVTDYDNGNVYTLDKSAYTENGSPIKRQIVSRHIFSGTRKKPISRVQINLETGVGLATGQGSSPQAMLRVSKDNGKTWGNEMWRSMGAIGENMARVYWNRLGSAYDWVFELTVTDPVKFVVADSWIGNE